MADTPCGRCGNPMADDDIVTLGDPVMDFDADGEMVLLCKFLRPRCAEE